VTEPPTFDIGDHAVIVDHSTTFRPYASREFVFRVTTKGTTTVYRIDVPLLDVADKSPAEVARYLLAEAPRATPLFSFSAQGS
jgi:hypothetical protein